MWTISLKLYHRYLTHAMATCIDISCTNLNNLASELYHVWVIPHGPCGPYLLQVSLTGQKYIPLLELCRVYTWYEPEQSKVSIRCRIPDVFGLKACKSDTFWRWCMLQKTFNQFVDYKTWVRLLKSSVLVQMLSTTLRYLGSRALGSKAQVTDVMMVVTV